MRSLGVLASWPRRRWVAAIGASIAFTLLVAIPTDLIDTPVFGREIPPTWWSWPALVISSALAGLLTATYVNPVSTDDPSARRGGYVGGLLTYLAVGCPVCNKVALLALGSAGAVTWFQPVQPVLTVAASTLLVYSLLKRLRGERACAVSPARERTSRAQS